MCDVNWYGSKCISRGCFISDLVLDCLVYGVCNVFIGVCYCFFGWMGKILFIMLRKKLFLFK